MRPAMNRRRGHVYEAMEHAAPRTWSPAALEARLPQLLAPGFRLACALLHDAATAEDVVQEAALKAWRKAGRLRPGSDPLPWFLGIVANECRSRKRER
jgi:DNA-directed RNA polymerase specialized sigma24 family protein